MKNKKKKKKKSMHTKRKGCNVLKRGCLQYELYLFGKKKMELGYQDEK